MNKNKATYPVVIYWFAIVCGIVGLFLLSGCGKKGPPIPLDRHMPPEVKKLVYTLKDDVLSLSWKIPATRSWKEYRLAGSKVYQSKIKVSECRDCPPRFKSVADIPVSKDEKGAVISGIMEYQVVLDKGHLYRFKVNLYTDDGIASRDSEIIEIEN